MDETIDYAIDICFGISHDGHFALGVLIGNIKCVGELQDYQEIDFENQVPLVLQEITDFDEIFKHHYHFEGNLTSIKVGNSSEISSLQKRVLEAHGIRVMLDDSLIDFLMQAFLCNPSIIIYLPSRS